MAITLKVFRYGRKLEFDFQSVAEAASHAINEFSSGGSLPRRITHDNKTVWHDTGDIISSYKQLKKLMQENT